MKLCFISKKSTYKCTKEHLYINEWNFIDMYTILIILINWTETMKETNYVKFNFQFLTIKNTTCLDKHSIFQSLKM